MFYSFLDKGKNITGDSLSPPKTMTQQGRILSTVSLIHAVNDGSTAVISILFPIFKEIFHLSYTQVGIITGGGLFIMLIAQLVLGRLADGKNVNSFLLTGLVLTSCSLVLLSFRYRISHPDLFYFLHEVRDLVFPSYWHRVDLTDLQKRQIGLGDGYTKRICRSRSIFSDPHHPFNHPADALDRTFVWLGMHLHHWTPR